MRNHLSFLLMMLAVVWAACDDARRDPLPSGDGSRASYLVTDPETDRLEFLLGRVGIIDELPAIRAGAKLGEKWTLVSISPQVLAPTVMSGSLDLSAEGVHIAHEFDGQDPYGETAGVAWFRFDFDTLPGKTTGRVAFDRRSGPDNGVSLEATFEGMANVYGREETYFKLEIFAGYPFAGK